MILVVDDERYIGTGLARLLRHAGCEAAAVSSGPEALAMLHVRKPSLMILDIHMPEMDGLTVLRTMRANPDFHGIPVVMHSADPHPPAMAEALALGAKGLLMKGAQDFEKLAAKIVELASRSLMHPSAAPGAPA